MGGCRCSYRTCSARSNPQYPLHMFHFPVFDKPRCHQWIINAQKLNFLDLKLSQLKNRMICQHHFKDSDFMNYRKQKLKPSAVPTLDGPYCSKKEEKFEDDTFIISLDDIENDQLSTSEKKARFSVKYLDFLTNDITDIPTLLPNPKTSINLNVNDSSKGLGKSHKRYLEKFSDDRSYYDSTLLANPMKSMYKEVKFDVVSVEYEDEKANAREIRNTEPKETSNQGQNSIFGHQTKIPTVDIKDTVIRSHRPKYPVPTNKKVKIISENMVSIPVTLCGELQTVSPNTILKVPDKKQKEHKKVDERHENNTRVFDSTIPLLQSHTQAMNEYQPATVLDMPNIENNINNQNVQVDQQEGQQMYHYVTEAHYVPFESIGSNIIHSTIANSEMVPTSATMLPDMPVISMPVNNTDNTTSTTMVTDVLNISNIPKEPMAVSDDTSIKHGDLLKNSIIPSAQDKQKTLKTVKPQVNSSPNKVHQESPSGPVNRSHLKNKIPPEKLAVIEEKRKYNMKLRDIIDSCLTTQSPQKSKELSNNNIVSEHLASVPNLPTSQENMISYLETRLQRMEDKLLNKIQENTKKIADIKKVIKPSLGKKSVSTQTNTNMDTKKQLYNQISQYLTPQANSLIYEELFINKYSQNVLNSERQTKKRKRTT